MTQETKIHKSESFNTKGTEVHRVKLVHATTALRYLPLFFKHGKVLVYQIGIPQAAARFFAHGLGGLFVGLRGLVGSRGAQRVIDINYLQHSRENGNVRGGEAVRVARAIGVFVMVADDRQD